MFEPLSASLREIAQNLQNKKISATEITTQCLSRIEKVEPKIAALLSIDSEGALARAAALDAKGPDPNKLLWGVPVTVKDVIVTKGIPTTAGSAMLKNFIPPYDAFVVEKLKEHGAVILGKNNMDEFAMGSTTENSAFGPTKNPWDITKVPGGSSGGSAASVASCECFASLGSDTGGSIRQPASFCGCVGVKPTYGRVSRYGVIAYGSSLDQVGPMARSVGDCARVLSVIAGHDTRDLTSAPYDTCDYEAACEKDIRGLTLGIPKEFYGEGLADDVRSVCEKTHALLEKAGARFVEVSVPHTKAAIATYYIIAMAEASSNLARFDGVRYGFRAKDSSELLDMYCASRTQGFGQEVKRRIMLGAFVLSSGYYDAYYCKAAQVRRIIRDEYVEALKKCDALLAPVSPTTAWAIGSHADDPLQMYLMDAYTLSLNLAGLPGISLPVGMSEKTHMPVGMQLLGRSFCEDSLLAIGAWIERIVPPIGIPTL